MRENPGSENMASGWEMLQCWKKNTTEFHPGLFCWLRFDSRTSFSLSVWSRCTEAESKSMMANLMDLEGSVELQC